MEEMAEGEKDRYSLDFFGYSYSIDYKKGNMITIKIVAERCSHGAMGCKTTQVINESSYYEWTTPSLSGRRYRSLAIAYLKWRAEPTSQPRPESRDTFQCRLGRTNAEDITRFGERQGHAVRNGASEGIRLNPRSSVVNR